MVKIFSCIILIPGHVVNYFVSFVSHHIPGLDKSKFYLLVWYSTSAIKYCTSLGFPVHHIHFSGQVKQYFTCPAKIFTCPGQPDNGFVRP